VTIDNETAKLFDHLENKGTQETIKILEYQKLLDMEENQKT